MIFIVYFCFLFVLDQQTMKALLIVALLLSCSSGLHVLTDLAHQFLELERLSLEEMCDSLNKKELMSDTFVFCMRFGMLNSSLKDMKHVDEVKFKVYGESGSKECDSFSCTYKSSTLRLGTKTWNLEVVAD